MPGHSYKGSRESTPASTPTSGLVIVAQSTRGVLNTAWPSSVTKIDGYESTDGGDTWYLQDGNESVGNDFTADNVGDLYCVVPNGAGPPPVTGQSNTVTVLT
jgi:hypothetical protein